MRLTLVRHAESHHSQRGLIADVRGCAGLTEHGVDQSRLLARRFSLSTGPAAPDALLTSPVPRARQTADILTAALAALSPAEDDGLCELCPGEADGMAWDAYRARFGSFDLIAEPDRPFAPGGESWAAFTRRVRVTLDRLVRVYDGRSVVAVTHAGFIVASVLVAFDIPRPGTRARLDPRHTSLTEWWVEEGIWHLERFTDATHLEHQGSREQR